MNSICHKTFRYRFRRRRRMSNLRRCILRLWDQIFICSQGKPIQCHTLPYHTVGSSSPASLVGSERDEAPSSVSTYNHRDNDSDLVALKISLLGDNHTGKTSFMEKYIGNEKEEGDKPINELNSNGYKTLNVKGARISYNLWEVDGDERFHQQFAEACKDSVAILIMFDLTSRVTLNSVISWYQEARKWNQTAIPIIIGTKFDDFIQLPMDIQWTIASQARAIAKALNATLFFSSATYNINVNKIFKFVTAKLFDIPWTVERNLTVGEPIIDF